LTSRSRIFTVSGRLLQSVSVAGDVPKVRDEMIGTLIKAAYVHTRCKKKNKNSKRGQRAARVHCVTNNPEAWAV
jgi:hypothetical protein